MKRENITRARNLRGFLLALLVPLCLLLSCSRAASAPRSETLRVMTYNIHHGEGADRELDLARIARVIREADADLVGLQEVDANFSARSNFIDQACRLASELDMHFVYGPAIIRGDPNHPNLYGNAVLSRYPITAHIVHRLPHPSNHEPRICLEACIDIGGESWTFMTTHLDHRSADVRMQQATAIADVLAATPTRTLLVGDFNCLPPVAADDRRTAVAPILDTLRDACAAGDCTAPTFEGGGRIDYIFVSPDLARAVKSYQVIKTDLTRTASDHYPLVVALEMPVALR